MTLLLLAIGILILGALAAVLTAKRPDSAAAWGTGSAMAGCLLGLAPALRGLFMDGAESLRLPWQVPGGEFHVRLDPLSAFFLVPIFLLSGLAAVYGGGYMRSHRDRKSFAPHWALFNLFIAGMALVVLARNALFFLLAWETMSLAAFFLVTFEHGKKEVRTAGWMYLVATHLGAAFILALFLLLGRHAGSLDFDLFGTPPLAPATAAIAFALALIGFGAKAGLVPLHVWLPEAHPAAPSHVSALMSGVMIKLGIYGILRTMTFLGPPAGWWGPLLLGLGMAGAVFGISMALSQRDLKRALAYSSIENVGLILLALGLGLWGLTRGHPLVATLGLAGAFLHLWNHSLMKGLMFLGAGSVLHGAGTRDMERLGGLMQRMPRTGLAMTIGALALAAVPPLNGFVSEWLIFMGLLHGGLELDGVARIAMLASVGVLSLVGGLALLCFVRLIGIVLLGESRSEEARHAHESSPRITVPLAILCALCILAALCPATLLNALSGPVSTVFDIPRAQLRLLSHSSLAPLAALSLFNATVWIALGACGVLLWRLRQRGRETSHSTWGCGYTAPTPRMQYTGRSFAELMVTRALPTSLRPKRTLLAPQGLFPTQGKLSTQYTDPANRGLYAPFFQWLPERCSRLRWVQQGKLHYYMAYFAVALILAFAWLALRYGVLP